MVLILLPTVLQLLSKINSGGGDDTLNIDITGSTITFDGGAGTDTVTLTGDNMDYSGLTLTNVEILSIDGTGEAGFDASQISGKSYVLRLTQVQTSYILVEMVVEPSLTIKLLIRLQLIFHPYRLILVQFHR